MSRPTITFDIVTTGGDNETRFTNLIEQIQQRAPGDAETVDLVLSNSKRHHELDVFGSGEVEGVNVWTAKVAAVDLSSLGDVSSVGYGFLRDCNELTTLD